MNYSMIIIIIVVCGVAIITFLALFHWMLYKLAHRGVPPTGLNNTAYTVPMQNPENRLYASGASASASHTVSIETLRDCNPSQGPSAPPQEDNPAVLPAITAFPTGREIHQPEILPVQQPMNKYFEAVIVPPSYESVLQQDSQRNPSQGVSISNENTFAYYGQSS